MDMELMGVATSAYQIEGAWNEDGKGASTWDHFVHTRHMENGDIACDEYHRISETVELLKELGANVYRFSVAWTRIQPNGTGEPNEHGLQYYQSLITALKQASIEPMITIYHWDLPQALEEEGGWTNRDTAIHFTNYAQILFQAFGHQVKYWITHNEPRVVATRGYGSSTMAPGIDDPQLIPLVTHHLLLSHGLAVNKYRELGLTGKIGITLNLKPVYCFDSGDPAKAAEADRVKNRAYIEPILFGKHPGMTQNSFVKDNDMSIIAAPIDFLGVNYYTRAVVAASKFIPEFTNALGWETFPQGMYDLLKDLSNRYTSMPPIIITENGFADNLNSTNGVIQDLDRIHYIKSHLEAVRRAKADGVNVIGYLAWSLMDNLEWSFGYKPRFGLVHVNFSTLIRTPKLSFHAYKEMIRDCLSRCVLKDSNSETCYNPF